MAKFTPLYDNAYAITNSMENLRFDKEGYFYVFVFYTGYFIKEIENISPVFPYSYRNTENVFFAVVHGNEYSYTLVYEYSMLYFKNILFLQNIKPLLHVAFLVQLASQK